MDKEIEVTKTVVETDLKDQLIVTVLSAIAGLVAGKMVEKGYYSTKARVQVHRAANNN